MMTEISGATSAESFGKRFSQLVNDPQVSAIVLDVNSPGGQIGGVTELSQRIYEARGIKPIVAVANQSMASAAYWIASAASELVVTPSGAVGSIGVFAVHEDQSAALEKEGVKVSLISEGKYKTEGNPYQPLSEEARASIQASVSEAYDAFVEAVARNRGVNPVNVRNGFGEGRMVKAQQAVKLGMADRVETLDETINRLLSQSPMANVQKATQIVNSPVGENLAGDEEAQSELEPQQALADEEESGEGNEAQARHGSRERRLALAKHSILEGVNPMQNIRELMKRRAELIEQASVLHTLAETEKRDLSEEERVIFSTCMDEADKLETQIKTLQEERERLDVAKLSLEAISGEAEKPTQNQAAKAMKRAEFDALSAREQAKFVRSGGKIVD